MTKTYTSPKVWKWEGQKQGRFTSINRPIAGATHEKELPIGKHPLQLYSLGTPNGVKVTVLLEELLAQGRSQARPTKRNYPSASTRCSSIRSARRTE